MLFHLSLPGSTIPAVLCLVLFSLSLYALYSALIWKIHQRPEESIVGGWRDEPGNTVIRFYRAIDGCYEAELAYSIVVKGLKFKDGYYSGKMAISRETGEWVNCRIRLKDDLTLKIRKRRGLSYQTQIWYRYRI